MSLRSRNASILVGLLFLVLPACGGGGSTPADYAEPLNTIEKGLVGEYELEDFSVFQPGTAPCGPSAFASWDGRMVLGADRMATLAIELCDQAGTPTAACDRRYLWAAETGLIRLYRVEGDQPDVCMEWVRQGMGRLTTHSILPTNEPDSGLILFEEGAESYSWQLVE